MTKSEKEEKERGAGKVAFWAHKDSIKRMLEAKHTVMSTYRAHKKEVDIEYQQFRRYVNELIRSKPDETKLPEGRKETETRKFDPEDGQPFKKSDKRANLFDKSK